MRIKRLMIYFVMFFSSIFLVIKLKLKYTTFYLITSFILFLKVHEIYNIIHFLYRTTYIYYSLIGPRLRAHETQQPFFYLSFFCLPVCLLIFFTCILLTQILVRLIKFYYFLLLFYMHFVYITIE